MAEFRWNVEARLGIRYQLIAGLDFLAGPERIADITRCLDNLIPMIGVIRKAQTPS